MKRVNRDSPIPAYYQIAMDMQERIRRQEWATGSQIPPEAELAKLYGVSRITMRQALAELVKDGILIRQRGSGTFVSQKPMPLVHDLSLPISFSGRLRQMGFTLSSEVLQAAKFERPLEQVRHYLQIDDTDPVAYLKRLLFINEQPSAIDRSWFLESLCPGISEQPLIENSLSRTLAERYGLIPVRSEIWLEVVRATEKDANLLKTFVDSPLILLTAVLYLDDDRPLEYSMTTWLGDRIRFNFHSRQPTEMESTFAVSLKDSQDGSN